MQVKQLDLDFCYVRPPIMVPGVIHTFHLKQLLRCGPQNTCFHKWIVELTQVALVFSKVVVFKTVLSLCSQSCDGEGLDIDQLNLL